jgi:cytochrome c oxidase subunit III
MSAIDLDSRVGKPKSLGMWLFILSDGFTFGALIAASVYIRLGSGSWPRPFNWLNLAYAFVMTLVLGLSSFTMLRAVRTKARKWLILTIVLGVVFLFLHAYEWARLFAEDIKPWSPGTFGASFFGITGLHMLHVLAGVVLLGLMVVMRRRFASENLEMSGLYWQFVDVVWLFVFVFLYVLSVG